MSEPASEVGAIFAGSVFQQIEEDVARFEDAGIVGEQAEYDANEKPSRNTGEISATGAPITSASSHIKTFGFWSEVSINALLMRFVPGVADARIRNQWYGHVHRRGGSVFHDVAHGFDQVVHLALGGLEQQFVMDLEQHL